ncbi:MAG: MFS transporter [Enterobacteriaceae bacterium]
MNNDNTLSLSHPMDRDGPQQEKKVRWVIPLALLTCVLLAFFDKVSITALFTDQTFVSDLGLAQKGSQQPALLGLLMTVFLFSYGISSALLSTIGDMFRPVQLMVWMMASWCLLMLLMGLTSSYQMMVILRILLGVAEGPLFALAFAIVRHTFPSHLQARATMLWLLGTPIGAAIGFPVTLYILQHFGWRATFFTMACLTLPVILFVYYGLRHVRVGPQEMAKAARDPVSAQPIPDRIQERRQLFANWHFWLICLFNVAFLTYLWGMNSWLPSYLIKGKQIDIAAAGILTSLPFIGMLVGEILGAWLSDRSDRRAAICFCSLVGAAAGLALVLSLDTPSAVVFAMAFSMFMWGAGAPNVFALLGKATSQRVSATAGGIFNGFGNLAGALAPLVMGALIGISGSMDSGLMFLVIMALIGSLALLPLIRRY